MDPLTALCNAITAISNVVMEIIKSQPPEVQKNIWDRYDDHMTFLRGLFHKGDK